MATIMEKPIQVTTWIIPLESTDFITATSGEVTTTHTIIITGIMTSMATTIVSDTETIGAAVASTTIGCGALDGAAIMADSYITLTGDLTRLTITGELAITAADSAGVAVATMAEEFTRVETKITDLALLAQEVQDLVQIMEMVFLQEAVPEVL